MLQPTYAICFLNEALFGDARYHHCFRVRDDEEGVLLCKDLEIHTLELSKFNVPVEEVKTPLERWCYFFKHGASLDLASLPATLDVPVIRKAVEVLMRVSQTELERQRYLERQRAERDAASLAEDARVAHQEGIEKGKRIGRIQVWQKILKQAEASSEELNRRSEEELLQMEESLERQFSEKKEVNGKPPADRT